MLPDLRPGRRGVEDYSLESAICKVSGTEFLWYAANRAMQLKGGDGYMRDEPYEKILRDIRIFPIFEGANDVMRAFVALSGMKPRRREALRSSARSASATRSARSACSPTTSARGSSARSRPDRITLAHPELSDHADAVGDQVKRAARRQRVAAARAPQGDHPAPVPAEADPRRVSDIFAQVAVLSRVSDIFEDQGVEPSGQERYIADTFCSRAAGRVAAPSTRSSPTTTSA